eukprot:5094716-Pyramimonas_sp.AAC.1
MGPHSSLPPWPLSGVLYRPGRVLGRGGACQWLQREPGPHLQPDVSWSYGWSLECALQPQVYSMPAGASQ